jgi:hypothetical protein
VNTKYTKTSHSKASQKYINQDFWYENIQSGNNLATIWQPVLPADSAAAEVGPEVVGNQPEPEAKEGGEAVPRQLERAHHRVVVRLKTNEFGAMDPFATFAGGQCY